MEGLNEQKTDGNTRNIMNKMEKRKKLFFDIVPLVGMILLIIILLYLYHNIELIKTDPCNYCMNQTGAVCYRGFQYIGG